MIVVVDFLRFDLPAPHDPLYGDARTPTLIAALETIDNDQGGQRLTNDPLLVLGSDIVPRPKLTVTRGLTKCDWTRLLKIVLVFDNRQSRSFSKLI